MILNYLWDGDKYDYRTLPKYTRYLREMVVEDTFYNLKGLKALIRYRIQSLE